MNLKAIIHTADEGGYWAEVPALPGCVTQGESISEIEENLRDAVDIWLDVSQDIILKSKTDKILELAL
jgi:predicted RNase H-like HicB family nuclease